MVWSRCLQLFGLGGCSEDPTSAYVRGCLSAVNPGVRRYVQVDATAEALAVALTSVPFLEVCNAVYSAFRVRCVNHQDRTCSTTGDCQNLECMIDPAMFTTVSAEFLRSWSMARRKSIQSVCCGTGICFLRVPGNERAVLGGLSSTVGSDVQRRQHFPFFTTSTRRRYSSVLGWWLWRMASLLHTNFKLLLVPVTSANSISVIPRWLPSWPSRWLRNPKLTIPLSLPA